MSSDTLSGTAFGPAKIHNADLFESEAARYPFSLSEARAFQSNGPTLTGSESFGKMV